MPCQRTAAGDAISPDDYTISGSQLTFDPGATSHDVYFGRNPNPGPSEF
ncbi:MAG TPA: hypothetical protein VMZ31_14935 [Phycisphaerae bacterium]|nr:hypothetical protein [Phycisphaerae bacterium]